MKRKAVFTTLFLSIFLAAISLATIESEDFVYDSKGKRNPFIPLITQKAGFTATGLENVQTVDDVNLEGIVWDVHGDSIAILNGVIVKKGEVIGNVKIKDIKARTVTLFINEVEYKLDFLEKGEKTRGEE